MRRKGRRGLLPISDLYPGVEFLSSSRLCRLKVEKYGEVQVNGRFPADVRGSWAVCYCRWRRQDSPGAEDDVTNITYERDFRLRSSLYSRMHSRLLRRYFTSQRERRGN